VQPVHVDCHAETPLDVRYAITAQTARGRCNGVASRLQRGSLQREVTGEEGPCGRDIRIPTWAPFLTPPAAERAAYDFNQILGTEEGWAKVNRHYMLRDWPGHLEFFFGEMFPEPHSTKQREDCVGWAMETTPVTPALRGRAVLVGQPGGYGGRPGPGALSGPDHPRAPGPLPAVAAKRTGGAAYRG
jgi:hypothetical protein